MAEYVNPDYVPEPLKMNVNKGLEGVVVEISAISTVNPHTNSLLYRGYPVQELAEKCSFEEVAYLLFFGELPNNSELRGFSDRERRARQVSLEALETIRLLPQGSHPMDSIRTAVSFLGSEDRLTGNESSGAILERAVQLLARIPTLIAADYRFKKGLEAIAPRTELTISENFFNMCFGKLPTPEIIKAFDVSLVLYAEHSFNASTFTARVVTSAQSDIYAATVAGISALKGSLHGGANEQVMRMMLEIGHPDEAAAWMNDALAQKKKIMGFGHRVYKSGDSRVPTMKKYAQRIAVSPEGKKWMAMYEVLEGVMLKKKSIYPNLDFAAGPAYYMMGFEIDFFTPIFVMARTAGWSAHIMEQSANNRIIRPLSEYVGHEYRNVVPLQSRT